MIIKICGVKNIETINCCEKNGINLFGLIFYENSPRNVTFDIAKKLVDYANNLKINSVGVFVNKDIEDLIKIISNLKLNYIQLHGDEDQKYINIIKKKFNIKVIKKISVATIKDLNQINKYDEVDYYLFDYKPLKKELPGGNAKSFDWTLLKEIKLNKPWFLSGGIDEKNINILKNSTNPDGIDLSSGVEEAPGIKSELKINNFIKKYYEN